MKQKEYLNCIDEQGEAIKPRLRSECHGNPGHLHRVIHVLVSDSSERLLLQKRAETKDIQPGKWDCSVGGHVDPGESIEEAARRECFEEIGVEVDDLEFLYEYTWVTDMESERVSTFRTRVNSEVTQSDETDGLEFLTESEIDELITAGKVTPNFIYERKLFRQWETGDLKIPPGYPSYSICQCRSCPRLVDYRESIEGRGKLREASYWNRPVPGFGDLAATILIVGLAPGAHGANRTGRPFTGDAAGDVLFETLYKTGFGSRSTAEHRGDGLWFNDLFISNAVKCVPPDNKPISSEIINCRKFLVQELETLQNLRCIVCLGRVAYDTIRKLLKSIVPERSVWKGSEFGNGQYFSPGNSLPDIAGLYHPSRRNLNTGLISKESFTADFRKIVDRVRA